MNNSSLPERRSQRKLGTFGLALLALSTAGTLLTSACQEPEVRAYWPEESTFAYSLEPAELDFGDVAVGETGTAQLFVRNTGDAPVLLTDLKLNEKSGFKLTNINTASVAAESVGAVMVQWTPVRSGKVEQSLKLTIGATPEDSELVSVPLKGTGMGPGLSLNINEYDFGEVALGCVEDVKLTLSNTGNEDLVVDRASLLGDGTFEVVDAAQLPLTIPPFQSHEVRVRFRPQDIDTAGSTLNFETNAGNSWAQISGRGAVDGEEVVDFEIAELGGYTTILVHVNEVVIKPFTWSWFAPPFEDSLPVLFQALHDSGNNFRIAFVWNRTGVVDRLDYIDNSYSVSRSVDLAMDMIVGGALMGDNDASYVTLENAIRANEHWLFENEAWEGSKLNLVAINRDAEQSGGSPAVFMATAQGFKDDDDNVLYHAIAGPPPTGCNSLGNAESFVIFKTAVDLTGGSFFSICDLDWTDNVKKLVANMSVGGNKTSQGADAVSLKGTPLIDSIHVTIDKKTLPTGWSYDSKLNSVVFDPEYVLAGKHVQVRYLKSSVCGG